ncbi:unnamed protein product [marine sediment metagenome]|uniref:PilZ domain-containing protein n=1 Tax=marine sediment metagenome TaxID=412755 RepID=X1UFB5_9ZZZZ
MADLSSIRPGLSADIVVNIDFSKEVVDIRSALIYDVIEKQIILSQTNPPITKYHMGDKIAVTYLVKEEEEPVRYGFYGKVTEFINDYELGSSNTVSAIVMERETEPVEFNLRMHFRIEPREDSGVALFIGGKAVNIIDISISGIQITHLRDHPIEPGKRVKGILNLDGEKFNIEAKVIRVWQPYDFRRMKDREFVAMQFLNMNKKLEDVLGRKIRTIERERRFNEMFP